MSTMGSGFMTSLDSGTNLIPKLTSGGFGVGRHLDKTQRSAFVGPFLEKGPRRRFHQLMGSVLEESEYLKGLEDALDKILADHPVLTVYGEWNDPFGFQARFKGHFPDMDEAIIARGMHFPMCDDPDGFANRVVEWHARAIG